MDNIERVVADIQARLVKLEQADAVADVHRKNVETRLKDIEDSLKWLVRLLIGALAIALLNFAIQGGLNAPPIP